MRLLKADLQVGCWLGIALLVYGHMLGSVAGEHLADHGTHLAGQFVQNIQDRVLRVRHYDAGHVFAQARRHKTVRTRRAVSVASVTLRPVPRQ